MAANSIAELRLTVARRVTRSARMCMPLDPGVDRSRGILSAHGEFVFEEAQGGVGGEGEEGGGDGSGED